MITTVFCSPYKTVGHTNWRVLVLKDDDAVIAPSRSGLKEFTRGTQYSTRYQYYNGQNWINETEHPRYNSNNGTTAGLPKGIAKVFYANEAEIKSFTDQNDTKNYPMVAGKGAAQYTFDVPDETQLALF